LAINRKELIDILFFGYGRVCNGPFLPGTFAYDENVEEIKQDVQKAKELLKEAGYDEKNPFTFEVITSTGNDIRINAHKFYKINLKKLV